MEHDLTSSGLDFTHSAFLNSKPVVGFWNDGWGVDIWATDFPHRILTTSWTSYKKNFIKNGRTIDPYDNNSTTSEGQSYTLLRSAWMDDKETFDSTLAWTKIRLQRPNGLYLWKWVGDDTAGYAPSMNTATDADEDIALALLFAYKKWGDENYFNQAVNTIHSIWNYEVVTINQTPYLTAGNWANTNQYIVINPSYLSPANYKIFAQADPDHPWAQLADSSYAVLQDCTSATLNKQTGVLPPEWCAIDKNTLEITQTSDPASSATQYGFNAIRTPWRIALDYDWFRNPQAKNYLATLNFISNEWYTKNKIFTVYQHNGAVWENYESAAAYGGDLGIFYVLDPNTAKKIYTEKIQNKFYENANNSYWEDPKNYYTQNWAWFATALYTNSIPTL